MAEIALDEPAVEAPSTVLLDITLEGIELNGDEENGTGSHLSDVESVECLDESEY